MGKGDELMTCTICRGDGPFTLDACVLDISKPICDRCADAIDSMSEQEDEYPVWKERYRWLDSVKNRTEDKEVSSFIVDLLNTAKLNPHFSKLDEEIKAEESRARAAAMAKHDAEVAPYNAVFEYAVESFQDNADGSANTTLIAATISAYAARGWRLHKVMVNELGRNSNTSGIGGITSGTNSTIDQTILIFERCVKPAEKK